MVETYVPRGIRAERAPEAIDSSERVTLFSVVRAHFAGRQKEQQTRCEPSLCVWVRNKLDTRASSVIAKQHAEAKSKAERDSIDYRGACYNALSLGATDEELLQTLRHAAESISERNGSAAKLIDYLEKDFNIPAAAKDQGISTVTAHQKLYYLLKKCLDSIFFEGVAEMQRREVPLSELKLRARQLLRERDQAAGVA